MIEIIVKYVKGPKDLSWYESQWALAKGYYIGRESYDEIAHELHKDDHYDDHTDLQICEEFFDDLNIAAHYEVAAQRSMSVGDIVVIKRNGAEKCYVVQHNGWKSQVLPHSKDACKRCAGFGYLPSFPHVEGGVCFRCNGNGRRK
mgnify:CR=1 FL=1